MSGGFTHTNSSVMAKTRNANSAVVTNLQANANDDAEAQCADTSFVRLEAGRERKEEFYDCLPFGSESGHHQLQTIEIINEIRTPKEFKGLLKQIAFTASILYRSFRHAYCKAKKFKQNKSFNSRKSSKKSARTVDRSDMNLYGLNSSKKQNLRKTEQNKHNLADEYKIEDGDKERICPICSGILEAEVDKFSLKNDTEIVEDFDDNCLKENNLCYEYQKDLEHLDYSERCAVLKGETPWPSREHDELQSGGQETEYSKNCVSSTVANKNQYFKLNPVCVTIPLKLQIDGQNCQTRILETEIVLDSSAVPSQDNSPVNIENPESEQHTNYVFLPRPKQQPDFSLFPKLNQEATISPDIPQKHTKISDNKVANLLPGSDTFFSISNSSMSMQPRAGAAALQQSIAYLENILDEILELLQRYFEDLRDTTFPATPTEQPLRDTEAEPQSKEAQSSEYTQAILALTSPMLRTQAPSTVETSPQFDTRLQAGKLGTELFEELRNVFEKATTKEASGNLKQREGVSLPINRRTTENPNLNSPGKALPLDYYKTVPKNTASPMPLTPLFKTTVADSGPQVDIKPQTPSLTRLLQLSELPSTSRDTYKKPKIPSEPSLIPIPPPPPPSSASAAPKLVSEIQQTDFSAIKPTGHYRRNEIRLEILEEMRELLQQSSSKAGVQYKAAERDEILHDFNRLIHLEKSERSSPQFNREMAARNIRYLIEPNGATSQMLQPSASQATILENIRYIVNPKNTPKTAKRKKYNKETKGNILEDLNLLLKPRKEKQTINRDILNYILNDLRLMLETGQDTFSPQRPARSTDTGPDSTKVEERHQKSHDGIRDNGLTDFDHMLDPSANTKQIYKSLRETSKRKRESVTSSNESFTNYK